MDRQIDNELLNLKNRMLAMGGNVEKAIDDACSAVILRDPTRFQLVHRIEKKINEQQMEMDQACFNLLARQAPVATDLRLILAVVKINNDLERMGDQAVNISYAGEDYLRRPALKVSIDLQPMADDVKAMVKDSLDAFVRRDVALSKRVLERDDRIDGFNRKIRDLMKEQMREDISAIEACLDMVSISKNLERVADHATNIAEEVIFLTTGDDIRHGHVHDSKHDSSDDPGFK
jgi:phosphate transport system protein